MPGLVGDGDGGERGLLRSRVEGAEIDQHGVRPRCKGAHLTSRDGHRGHGAAASSMLAVKVCATALVMQCTRGRLVRMRSKISAVIAGKSLSALGISPSAGMTRIRFYGLAFALSPAIGVQSTACFARLGARAPHEIAAQLLACGPVAFKGRQRLPDRRPASKRRRALGVNS